MKDYGNFIQHQELMILKYQFAGKTGTAQVKRISKRERELDLRIRTNTL